MNREKIINDLRECKEVLVKVLAAQSIEFDELDKHLEFINGKLDNVIDELNTKDETVEFKTKADKWDALKSKIEKCYLNSEGEYDEDNPEIEGADLGTIGEMAATAFGWL